MENLKAFFGGTNNITNCTWKTTQTYTILDLELECIRDNLKPVFLNDLVEPLSDRIKEQPLLTLDGAFNVLANIFESN